VRGNRGPLRAEWREAARVSSAGDWLRSKDFSCAADALRRTALWWCTLMECRDRLSCQQRAARGCEVPARPRLTETVETLRYSARSRPQTTRRIFRLGEPYVTRELDGRSISVRIEAWRQRSDSEVRPPRVLGPGSMTVEGNLHAPIAIDLNFVCGGRWCTIRGAAMLQRLARLRYPYSVMNPYGQCLFSNWLHHTLSTAPAGRARKLPDNCSSAQLQSRIAA